MLAPVLCYGMELFDWSADDAVEAQKAEIKIWRQVLRLGGRAPQDCIMGLTGRGSCTLEWRVRRVSHFLRLIDSPPDSWQHLAIHCSWAVQAPWFVAARADLYIVLPSIVIRSGFDTHTGDPFLYSTGCWTEEGNWSSVHPYRLKTDVLGRRHCTKLRQGGPAAAERSLIRAHIQQVSRELRRILQRDEQSSLCTRVITRSQTDGFAKSLPLVSHILSPGPPLHTIMDWIDIPWHRQAFAAYFVGDLFLGRYAGNYFAKQFLPNTTAQLNRVSECGVPASRVCLHCWHSQRQVFLEDELHVLYSCPRYDKERRDWLGELAPETQNCLRTLSAAMERHDVIFRSHSKVDWKSLSKLLARVRQSRRKLRGEFQIRTARLQKVSFAIKKAAWRAQGKHVCRHGVFFDIAAPFTCPCSEPVRDDTDARWALARRMPAIDEDLRTIITTPFCADVRLTLRSLQNRLRAQDSGL